MSGDAGSTALSRWPGATTYLSGRFRSAQKGASAPPRPVVGGNGAVAATTSPSTPSVIQEMSSPGIYTCLLSLSQPLLFPSCRESDLAMFVSLESLGEPVVVTASTAVVVTVDKKTAIAAGKSCPSWG